MKRRLFALFLTLCTLLLLAGCMGVVTPKNGSTVDPSGFTQMVFAVTIQPSQDSGAPGFFNPYRGPDSDWIITEELLWDQHKYFHYNKDQNAAMTVTNANDPSEVYTIVDASFSTYAINLEEESATVYMTATLPATLKHGQTYEIDMPEGGIQAERGTSFSKSLRYQTTHFSTEGASRTPIEGIVVIDPEAPQCDGDSMATAGALYRVTASRLNVRADAGVQFPRIGQLLKGTMVTASPVQEGWAVIEFGDGLGYVSMAYLEKE